MFDPFNPGSRGPPCCMVKELAEGVGDDLVEDGTFYCTPHWVKNSILLFGRKKSVFPFHCLIGAHWAIMLTTYAQIIGFTLIFIFVISEHLPTGFTIATVISLLIVLLAFTITASTDPGIVYKTSENEIVALSPQPQQVTAEDGLAVMEQALVECSRCDLMRPRTARHCNYCGVCVNKVRNYFCNDYVFY